MRYDACIDVYKRQQEASILGLEEGSPALEVEDYVHLSNGQLFNVSRIVLSLIHI